MTVLEQDHLPHSRAWVTAALAAHAASHGQDARHVRTLGRLLHAIYGLRFHARLDQLLADYEPHNPDVRPAPGPEASHDGVDAALTDLLVGSNFVELTTQDVERSVSGEGIFPISYDVDMRGLRSHRVFVRGQARQQLVRPALLGLRQRTVDFDAYALVCVVLRFQQPQRTPWERLRDRVMERLAPRTEGHVVGRTYIKLIRNVPKPDLEVIFPDVVPRMKSTQMLQVALPFITGVGLLIHQFLIRPALEGGAQHAGSGLSGVVLAVMAALAGHAYKTWQGYRLAVKQFLAEITQSLYFRSLAVNGGALHWLADAAEEEESKEALLALYFLASGGPATPEELKKRVDAFAGDTEPGGWGFPVEDALRKLRGLGLLTEDGATVASVPLDRAVALLRERAAADLS